MTLTIQNMSGAGNLFNVIDNRTYGFSFEQMKFLVPLIVEKTATSSFQTEGVMFIESSKKFDFQVYFFNNDSSSGMMCGNGGRCAVRFAENRDFFRGNVVNFFMSGDNYSARFDSDLITLNMPNPRFVNNNFYYKFRHYVIRSGYYDVGSDHFVIEDKTLQIDFNDDNNFIEIAKEIRNDLKAFPKGVNVNLYSIDGNHILIKTFERGIEKITGACGTGAISTAIHCHLTHAINTPITLYPPSNSPLRVEFLSSNEQIQSIRLTGEAVFLDKVEIDIKGFI